MAMNNNCLKVGIAVIGLLLVIITVTITSLICDCPGKRVKFVSPVSDIELPCGAQEEYILCNYTINNVYYPRMGFPCWIINSIPYCQSSVPPDGFRISGASLVVIDSSLPGVNNTRISCKLELAGSDSNICPCSSPERLLITKMCEAPRIECMPVYSLKSSGHGSLQRINTTLNLTNLEADDNEPTYIITYSNSLGNVCDSSIIDPASNCTGRICNHVFEVSSYGSSGCSNTSNIGVIVSSTNSDVDINTKANVWKSKPMIIDTLNRFVNVSVTDMRGSGGNSAIKCLFLEKVSNVENLMYCAVAHGPDCRNLRDPQENLVTNTESIQFDIDLSYLGNNTEVCVSVIAGIIGNKMVKIEGFYDISKQIDIGGISTTTDGSAFQAQISLRLVGFIELTIVIIMMYVF